MARGLLPAAVFASCIVIVVGWRCHGCSQQARCSVAPIEKECGEPGCYNVTVNIMGMISVSRGCGNAPLKPEFHLGPNECLENRANIITCNCNDKELCN